MSHVALASACISMTCINGMAAVWRRRAAAYGSVKEEEAAAYAMSGFFYQR